MATVLTSTCHCGAVRIEVRSKPRQLTSCNCSICRRYGTLWAYYKVSSAKVICAPGATTHYSWQNKDLKFVRCKTCGCVTHWIPARVTAASRMGVNARNFEPAEIESLRVRRLDGAFSWKFLD